MPAKSARNAASSHASTRASTSRKAAKEKTVAALSETGAAAEVAPDFAPRPSVFVNPDDDHRIAKLTPDALALMADFFKVLSEVSRLQIVCALKSGAKNVTEIIDETGLGQANVSKHLKMLTQAGIVAREQRGVCVYYQIASPFLFELCDLVCDALALQVEHQASQFQQLSMLRQSRD